MSIVEVYLAYPSDKLEFVEVDYTGSDFDFPVEGTGGDGSIHIIRGNFGSVSGDKLIANIKLKAKGASGSAQVSFEDGSAVLNTDGQDILSGTSGGTYTISATTTSEKAATKTTTSTREATTALPDQTAPVISNVKLADVGFHKVTIYWETSEDANSEVEYGPSDNLGLSASNSKLEMKHLVTLEGGIISPTETYYYKIKSTDEAGNQAESSLLKFETKGYTLNLKVLDPSGKPLSGVSVTLFSDPKEAGTNADGVVEFVNINPDNHSVLIKHGFASFSQEIFVADASKKVKEKNEVGEFFKEVEEPQEYTIILPQEVIVKSELTKYTLVLASALLLMFVSFGFWWHKIELKKLKAS